MAEFICESTATKRTRTNIALLTNLGLLCKPMSLSKLLQVEFGGSRAAMNIAFG